MSIAREEEMKRQAVFTKEREWVLIKILAMPPLEGVRRIERKNEEEIEANHSRDAEKRGLDPYAYRPEKVDTGYFFCVKEEGVRITYLVQELNKLGLNFTDVYYQINQKKGPITTLVFSKGKAMPIPPSVRKLERMRFNHCTVACNLRFRDPEDKQKGQYRLDTINLAKGLMSSWEARELEVWGEKGSTYRLTIPSKAFRPVKRYKK